MNKRIWCRLGIKGRLLTLGIAVFTASTEPASFAQTSASASLKAPIYDAVSIKPNTSGNEWVSISVDPDRYSATNVSLKSLIEKAYGIKVDLIFGEPRWVDSARFDIKAKIVEPDIEMLKNLTPEQNRLMFQSLLSDRFQLRVHKENKVLPIYEMVITKDGPKFKQSPPSASVVNEGSTGVRRGSISVQNTELTAHAVPMVSLADQLSHTLHRAVIDKTGLVGDYDFSLKWDPDYEPGESSESSTASIFPALQDQLGLKLQSTKGPVETLVIDHVEMPSEN
jgi:uncharacterized protein (TIGR03435 family)